MMSDVISFDEFCDWMHINRVGRTLRLRNLREAFYHHIMASDPDSAMYRTRQEWNDLYFDDFLVTIRSSRGN